MLRYHFDDFVVEWLPGVASTLGERPLVAAAARFVSRELLSLYLEQALYVDLLAVAREVFRARYLIAQGMAAAPVAAPAELAAVLQQSVQDSGVKIVPSLKMTASSRVRALRRQLREAIRPLRRAPPLSLHGGTIAVELVEGADPARKGDAFWLAAGLVDPARVLFVLEGTNRALLDIESNLAAIRRVGAQAVALDARMTAGGRVPYWRPGRAPDWAREMRAVLPAAADPPDRWLRRALMRLAKQAGDYHSFYAEHGVVAIQQFTELSTDTVVKRVAIDRVGGIEIGKMRSQWFELTSAAFHFQHEIAFVWHENVAPYLRAGHTRTRALVAVGYPYDRLPHALREDGARLRRRFGPHVSMVAAVFDNDPHLNGHFSSADLETFYRCVLRLAARHDSLGVIVKSKKPGVLAKVPSISREFDALVRAGRCLILEDPLSSVIPAALAAELALGFPASTAPCEAALAGCRVVMFDSCGSSRHPWLGVDKGIIFHDPVSFEEAASTALREITRGRRGTARERLLELDPFLDGDSSRRAAEFLNAFAAARQAGCDKRRSLEAAIQHAKAYVFGAEAGA